MIPIRDTARPRRFPIVNWLIIATNGLFFLLEIAQRQGLREFIETYGLVPARVVGMELGPASFVSFFMFMFLHGSVIHLLANMWSLYIFGDNVEDRLGSGRYLLFYLAIGLTSGLGHVMIHPDSTVPTIGASGAIAGVMGAYAVMFPRSKILTLVPLFIFFYFIEVPAYVFVAIWFVFQFASATGAAAQKAGIAWWAHIAGFVFGIILSEMFAGFPHLTAKKKEA
jgi:hypothetical protein